MTCTGIGTASFAHVVLTTLLGVDAELAAPENRQNGNRIVIADRDSAQDGIYWVGQELPGATSRSRSR